MERHLPHLELQSGRLYHTETPTGYYLSEVVKDDVYWASPLTSGKWRIPAIFAEQQVQPKSPG